MLKDATHKEKLDLLQDWLPYIIQSIKSELKNDHLKQDWNFVKTYFENKNVNKLTAEELVAGYQQALAKEEKASDIAEFIFNRWLLKNTELYQYFEDSLTKIDPNFTDLKELSQDKSLIIAEGSVRHFGAPKTYIFSVINSVVFPKTVFDQLRKQAAKSHEEESKEATIQKEQQSLAAMEKNHQLELARLTDKYEKKLLGLQKKYTLDTENLKKQIATLQRKCNG